MSNLSDECVGRIEAKVWAWFHGGSEGQLQQAMKNCNAGLPYSELWTHPAAPLLTAYAAFCRFAMSGSRSELHPNQYPAVADQLQRLLPCTMAGQEIVQAYEVQIIHEALEKSHCTRSFAEVVLFSALMLQGIRNIDEWQTKNIETVSRVTGRLSGKVTEMMSASTAEGVSRMIELVDHVFHEFYENLIRLTGSARTLLIGPMQYSALIKAQNNILAELCTKGGVPLTGYEIRMYRERLQQAHLSTYDSLVTINCVESYELHADCLNHMLDNLRAIGTGFWKDMQLFRSPD